MEEPRHAEREQFSPENLSSQNTNVFLADMRSVSGFNDGPRPLTADPISPMSRGRFKLPPPSSMPNEDQGLGNDSSHRRSSTAGALS